MPATLHLNLMSGDRQTDSHPSVSSSSIITVQSPPDKSGLGEPIVHVRSASPSEGALLAARAFKGPAPQEKQHGNTYDPFDLSFSANDGLANLDRWSNSTTDSIAATADRHSSSTHRTDKRRMAQASTPESANRPYMKHKNPPSPSSSPQMNRASPTQGFRIPSAGNKLDEYRPGRVTSTTSAARTRSPRASPSRIERLGANGLRIPASDMRNRPRQSSPLSSPVPRLLTPGAQSVHGTPLSAVESADYFGLGTGISKDVAAVQRSGSSRPTSPGASIISVVSSRRPQDSTASKDRDSERSDSPSADKTRLRTKERREKDKKAMLSKALEKANTAVLLDNAVNYEGALDAYTDACKLLLHVVDRTVSDEDKRKLNAIRVTYTTRIDELRQLLQPSEKITNADAAAKSVPPRPSSQASQEAFLLGAKTQSSPQADGDQRSNTRGTNPSITLASAQHRQKPPSRDSFLTDVIREVEGSRSSGFLGPLWEKSKSPMARGLFGESSNPSKEELHSAGAPSPLAPARSASPAKLADDSSRATLLEANGNGDSKAAHQPDALEAMSWLNTIDESESDDARFPLHSSHGGKVIRRKNLLLTRDESTSDFDAAFDAAVEAAYEDGFEPETPGEPQLLAPTTYNASYGSVSRTPLAGPGPTLEQSSTADSTIHGFDFNLNAQSAMPRTSDSTENSKVTSHSSKTERGTANTSLSPTTKRSSHARRKSNTLSASDYPSAVVSAIQRQPSPSSTDVERPSTSGAHQVRDRTNDGLAPLTIQTSIKTPQRNRAISQASDNTTPPSVVDVAPWTVQGLPGDFKSSRVVAQRNFHDGFGTHKPVSSMSGSTDSPGSSFTEDVQSTRHRGMSKLETGSALRPSSATNDDLTATTPTSTFSMPYTQRLNTTSSARTMGAIYDGGNAQIFDTSLQSASTPGVSPIQALEPCPESVLLRPFWLLRTVQWALMNSRGGYLTNRLFLPREAWLNKSLKLKNVEDKVSSCDTLATSLTKLASVDTYDAEAVLVELQVFEQVMDRVQSTLAKKLGGEVGASGVASLFKEAAPSADSPPETATRDSMKMHSGKSYLSSWRKLRGKTLSGGTPISLVGMRTSEVNQHTMSTVPMTTMIGQEKHAGHRRDALRDASFEGPHREYMSSLARLCEAAQSLDQIARQVEDPGLRHSSPTHVGLELSMRHTAEFFALYICRFILADIGIIVDKHVKRSTEWLLV